MWLPVSRSCSRNSILLFIHRSVFVLFMKKVPKSFRGHKLAIFSIHHAVNIHPAQTVCPLKTHFRILSFLENFYPFFYVNYVYLVLNGALFSLVRSLYSHSLWTYDSSWVFGCRYFGLFYGRCLALVSARTVSDSGSGGLVFCPSSLPHNRDSSSDGARWVYRPGSYHKNRRRYYQDHTGWGR